MIINFEVAKEKRLEEKNRQAQWLQERGQQPVKPVDANSPSSPQAFIERDQKPHPDKQRGITRQRHAQKKYNLLQKLKTILLTFKRRGKTGG
jgi:hypothetical protein